MITNNRAEPGDSINLHGTLNHCSKTIYLHPVNEPEVDQFIAGLDVHKKNWSRWHNYIEVLLSSHMPAVIQVNSSFAEGVYPDQLKIANVIRSDKNNPKNYRLISVTPAINEIFVSMIKKRIAKESGVCRSQIKDVQ